MPDLIRFVDSISATPTTRLDLNDETSFWVKSFSAPPPRLRRSMASNAMRDGVHVGSATYGERMLTVEIECRKTTQDAAATEMQKLWRELDRTEGWLQYQPQGASKPVFFRLFRSDASQLADVVAQAAMRTFTVELLAEPFALGLMETLGPYAVGNDTAAASNPGYVDISGVVGDVPVEAIFWNTAYNRVGTLMAIRPGEFSDVRPYIQAESMTLGTDTTNPGGGPDAAMSGTGTNNFVRTSFSSGTSMQTRLAGSVYTTASDQSGTWVAYALVRRFSADTTSDIYVGLSNSSATGPVEAVPVPKNGDRQLVRLGVISTDMGKNYSAQTMGDPNFKVWAQRTSGTGTLDWDFIALFPADYAMLETTTANLASNAAADDVFDGVSDRTYAISDGGNPTALATQHVALLSSGRIPYLVPNVTTRLHFLTFSARPDVRRSHTKQDMNNLTIYYWPRYLFVRPVAS